MGKDKRGGGSIRVFFQSIREIYKDGFGKFRSYGFWLPLYAVTYVLAPLVLVFIPPIVIGFVSSPGGLASQSNILYFCVSILAIVLVAIILNYLQAISLQELDGKNTIVRTQIASGHLINKMVSLDYCQFEPQGYKQKIYKALSAINSNWVGYERMMKEFTMLIAGLLGSIVYGIWSIFISPWVFLLLVAMAVAHVLFALLSRHIDAKAEKKEKSSGEASPYSESEYWKRVASNEAYGKDIRNYNLQRYILSHAKKAEKRYRKSAIKGYMFHTFAPTSDALFMFGVNVLAYITLLGLFASGQIDISGFTFLIGIIMGFSSFLSAWTESFNEMVYCLGSMKGYLDYLSLNPEMNHSGKEALDKDYPLHITLDHVWFRYPDSESWILKDLSMDIEAGEECHRVHTRNHVCHVRQIQQLYCFAISD